MDFWQILFLLLCGHAVMDFSLQTDWLARNKNRHARKALPPEMQKSAQIIWPHLMTAHALSHGLAVYLATGNVMLGAAETAVHWITDFAKCERWIGFHTDQFIHMLCKVLWAYLAVHL